MKTNNSILAVGSIAYDTLKTSRGHRENSLGGSATFFGISASHFTNTQLVGIVGNDFPQSDWDILHSYNIDTENIQQVNGSTFRWGGEYSDDYSTRTTLFTELGVFENFKPIIKNDYQQTEFLFLGNILPELQISVFKQLSKPKCIITDTMNLWIDIAKDKLWEVINFTDIFLLNDEEAIQLTGQEDLHLAADELLKKGPKTVVIKQGSNGALLATNREKIHIPIYPDADLVDPTGAGDSFAGGFMGYIAQNGEDNLVQAVVTGSAIASFTVEGFGIEGIQTATKDKIQKRINIINKLIQGV
jgi:cytidine kinase